MSFRKLLVYQKALKLATEIYLNTNQFPKEEVYSLTDQIRRSSRSVCSNIAEAYYKRLYPKHFVSKLSDANAENAETLAWIDIAQACGYFSAERHKELMVLNEEVGRLLSSMIKHPNKYA